MEEGLELMKEDSGYILLDVRRTDEFEEGHIPGAINIPNESIGTEEIAELPDQKQTIAFHNKTKGGIFYEVHLSDLWLCLR